MKRTVYIFRGAPATGKGTVIPKFCDLLPKPVAFISQDIFRWGFHLVGREIKDVTDNEHTFALRNTERIFEEYLKNGNYVIVIEGLFTWSNKNSSQGSAKKLRELVQRYEFDVKNILLKADKAELIERNAKREYSVPLDEFEVLYNNIYSEVGEDEIVIDSTGQTTEETQTVLENHIQL